MKIIAGLMIPLLTGVSVFAATSDRKGCPGDSLFTRMPGTHITDCVSSDFDSQLFHCAPGKPAVREGRYMMTRYQADPGAAAATPVQIIRNHQSAAQDLGGRTIFEDKRYACIQLAKAGKEITAEIDTAFNRGYLVRIIEKAGMKQEIAGNTDIFLKSIKDTGHVAVYGILFDTGLAVLKPGSESVLAEITKLLQQDQGLNIHVVGHTDNVGTMANNMKLSQDRATAVVEALVSKHGIARTRLKAAGVGPLVPVSTNRNEAGRAKNRRVELVEQ
ncbi:MAG: OmpA family protein [Elusimicrobiota bacterium]|jgi:outer membrane protein OmpA-like peptidoglycan-associated protein